MGGWNKDSNMPSLYGRRFIASKANTANLRRISTIKSVSLSDIEEVFN